MSTVKRGVCAISAALIVAAIGCGSDSDGTGGIGEGDEVPVQTAQVIELSHSYFKPAELTLSTGDTVIFRNLETMSHPLVSKEAGLDTGEFTKGDRSFTFGGSGTFTIENTAHGTTLTIVVKGGGG
jgi:plastocyanin